MASAHKYSSLKYTEPTAPHFPAMLSHQESLLSQKSYSIDRDCNPLETRPATKKAQQKYTHMPKYQTGPHTDHS